MFSTKKNMTDDRKEQLEDIVPFAIDEKNTVEDQVNNKNEYEQGTLENNGSQSYFDETDAFVNNETNFEVDKEDKTKEKNKRIIVWSGICFVCFLFVCFGVVTLLKNNNKDLKETKPDMLKELIETEEEERQHGGGGLRREDNDKVNNDVEIDDVVVANDYVEDVNTLPDMVESVMPSMVSITTTGVVSYYSPFFSSGISEYETEGSGSGIIIAQLEDELLILTNEHVINSMDDVSIGFIDDTIVDGYTKSYDVSSDLAIIGVKTEDIPKETLDSVKIAVIGDSNSLRLGETVVAIGNSLGYGQSVTKGIVSALNREVEMENGITRNFIQTDAPINPGNSGGALLNMKGEVIGINESKIASSEIEGVGFAIPVSNVEDIIESLKNKEYREKLEDDEHGWLGISCRAVTSDVKELYNIPMGVFVYDVAKGGSADVAGIIKGDVIVSFDGTNLTSADTLVDLVSRYKVGETVEVVLMRYENGEYREKTIELTMMPVQYEEE